MFIKLLIFTDTVGPEHSFVLKISNKLLKKTQYCFCFDFVEEEYHFGCSFVVSVGTRNYSEIAKPKNINGNNMHLRRENI